MTSKKRVFLFLQGPATPFFSRLAKALNKTGQKVLRIHFNAGDLLYWSAGHSHCYSGSADGVVKLVDHLHTLHGITDLVLFGDRRPVHRAVVLHSDRLGIRSHVFEEGYFRPFWITLEREGVNGHSLIPRDPDWFSGVAKFIPEPKPPKRFRSAFWKRAVHDVCYHAAGILNPLFFWRYVTHALDAAPIEYAGYIRRFSRNPILKRRNAPVIKQLLKNKTPFYLLPLQLNADAQIRDHSRFDNMIQVIEYVVTSFSLNSKPDALLVIKTHPLDYGWTDYQRVVNRVCRVAGLDSQRVVLLESGSLDHLSAAAAGMVTVNSTAGIVALQQGCSVMTLSDPIYNLPGLTWQGSLDEFWGSNQLPDGDLFNDFYRVVMFATQINGGFYCSQGMDLAVENAARVLSSDTSPLEFLLSLEGQGENR